MLLLLFASSLAVVIAAFGVICYLGGHDDALRNDHLYALLKGMEKRMSAQMDVLSAQVKANTSVVDSALELIRGLAQRIQDLIAAGADPVALQALADELKAKDEELAAAVVANAPPPVVVAPADVPADPVTPA